jgi:putative heme-binding domain-containing protein
MKFVAVTFRSLACIAVGAVSLLANAGVGEGQELYDAYCQVCHGGLGEGQAMGKPLTDTVANRLSDIDLLTVINEGRSGTGMAAWEGSFNEEEIFDIASYVRTLQGKPGLNLDGDDAGPSDDPAVLAGAEIFNGKAGCISCHSYDDQGGSIGPALDGVSSRLATDALEQALLNPSATIVSGYAIKVIEQQDGTVMRGRFRNDSELAVQLQSEDGRRWVTYFKDRVKSISDSDESLMPDIYGDLGASEQEQLIGFLRSL